MLKLLLGGHPHEQDNFQEPPGNLIHDYTALYSVTPYREVQLQKINSCKIL